MAVRDTKEGWALYMQEYRKKNPDKMRAIDLKKNYDLPIEEYIEMLLDQKGVCAVCEQPETSIDHRTKKVRNLAVDHNHVTGKVRGLLCSHCNRGMGFLREDIKILRNLIKYLEDTEGSPGA